MLKKKIKISLISVLTLLNTGLALAQTTVLPAVPENTNCQDLLDTFNSSGKPKTSSTGAASDISVDATLGCAITTGRVSLAMIPYFIQYISNYILGLISLVALLFVVIGGFLYTMGGLGEQKDKGKAFIKNALIGMSLAFLAWTIVNVVLSAITG